MLYLLFCGFCHGFYEIFSKKVYTTPIHRIPPREHLIFWLSKILYVVFYILLPVYFLGFTSLDNRIFFCHACFHGSVSCYSIPAGSRCWRGLFVDANSAVVRIEEEWAIHQVRTTADFATENKLVSWLLGGLNFQVEHHLFPKVSHVHYPAIRKIVHEVCEIHGLKHINYPTMGSAIHSHFRFMKYLGRN